MRRKLSLLLAMLILLSCMSACTITTPDPNGNLKTDMNSRKVIYHMYTTDKKVYIDDILVPTYAIDGRVVVSEHDLVKCGFTSKLDKSDKVYRLSFTSEAKPKIVPVFQKLPIKSGKKVADVYNTYIRVKIDRYDVDACYIGSQFMISLDNLVESPTDMHDNTYGVNTPIDYSYGGVRAKWDGKSRILDIHFLREGTTLQTKYGTFPIVGTYSECLYDDYQSADLNFSTLMPTAVHDEMISNKNTSSQKHYADVARFFNQLSIKPTWIDNALTIQGPIQKKAFNWTFPKTKGQFTVCAILPVLNVPVQLNENGETVKKSMHMIVFNGELWTDMDDWKEHLITNAK